jgi:hypothetical protein
VKFDTRRCLRFFCCLDLACGVANLFAAPPSYGSWSSIFWISNTIGLISIYLSYAFIEKDLAKRAGLRMLVHQARILKWIKPVVDILLPILIECAYGAAFINFTSASRLYFLEAIIFIGLKIWAATVFWSLFQAFRRARRDTFANITA